MKEFLSLEQAQKEVNSWLDFKKVSLKKRETLSENIEKIVDGFVTGELTLNPDTFEIIQTLNFPFGEEVKVKTLTFKPRITVGEFQQNMTNVKTDDGYGRVFAYIAALTGQHKAVISKMDADDYSLSSNIVVFFMV